MRVIVEPKFQKEKKYKIKTRNDVIRILREIVAKDQIRSIYYLVEELGYCNAIVNSRSVAQLIKANGFKKITEHGVMPPMWKRLE